MLKVDARGGLLVLAGDAGYEEIPRVREACAALAAGAERPVTVDLSGVALMASPCLGSVYDLARRVGYGQLTVRVARNLHDLFAPGEAQGLFRVEIAGDAGAGPR